MVVLEIIGGGKHARFERVANMPVSIGRAFDNDVIVDDPYVDPHHLTLDQNEDKTGWIVSDFSSAHSEHDSKNDEFKNEQDVKATAVKSGDELHLGKTRVRFYAENHAVAPTLSLRDLEHRLLEFDAVRWVVTLMVALLGMVCLQMYLGSTIDMIKPDVYATTAITILGSIVVVGGFWSLIARILKGETRFSPLVNLTLMQSIAALLLALLVNVVFFNLPGMPGREFLQNIISLFLFVTYVYLCMVLTTKLNFLPKAMICGVIFVGTLGFMAISGYSKEDQFIFYPKYDGTLYSPQFLVRPGTAEDEFRSRLPSLFERANEMIDAED